MSLFSFDVTCLFVWCNIEHRLLLPDPHISSMFTLSTLGSVGGEQDESYGLSASPRKRHTAGPKSDRTRCPLLSTRLLRDFMSYVLLLAFVREQRPERCDRYRSIEEGRHLLKYIRVLLKPGEPRRRNTRALISDQEALECMIQDSSRVRAIKTKGLSKIMTTIVLGHTMTR